MDVTCTRCGTVYEFEESLISTTGTTVKCTQCGHLFKVHRPGASSERPSNPDAFEPRELRWRVRRVDGSTHMLESLAELTRLISAGQFTRDDEISRTGQVWKRLGEIHELASLIEPVRPRRTSDMTSLQASTAPPAVPSAGAEPVSSAPPLPEAATTPRPRLRSSSDRFQVMGTEVALDSSEPTRQMSTRAEAEPAPAPAPAQPEPAAPAGEPRARTNSSAGEELPALPEELPDFRPHRSRLWVWLAFGIPLAAAAGIGSAYVMRPRPQPLPEPPTRAYLLRADEALASHVPARFDEAISEYTKALAFHPDDAHILSSISRVYAVWSDLTFSRHQRLHAGEDANAAELDALQAEARRLADQAKLYGERAAQRNPGNEEASVALSDALRLTGNLVAARAELDRARATEGVASAETLRVAALLAIDEANGDARAGRGLIEQAVARDPKLIRARVLYARCLAHDGDYVGARMHLDAPRNVGAAHPVLDELRSAIDREEQRRRPPSANAVAAAPAHAAPAKPDGPPATPRGDPAEIARRGEAALERGLVQSAERLFDEALAIEPGLPRAKTGLGYVALERSQPRTAVLHFRPAARNGNPEALIGLGDAYRRLGRMRDALEAYREYMQRFPRGERRSIAQRQVELLSEQLQQGP